MVSIFLFNLFRSSAIIFCVISITENNHSQETQTFYDLLKATLLMSINTFEKETTLQQAKTTAIVNQLHFWWAAVMKNIPT